MTRTFWEDADAFADVPVFTDWRELDKKFPEAKFILSVRNPELWYQSFERTLGGFYTAQFDKKARKKFHRVVLRCYETSFKKSPLNHDHMIHIYKEHNEGVIRHFRPRRGKLFQVDVSTPGALAALSKFLGLLPKNFPNMNKISKVKI